MAEYIEREAVIYDFEHCGAESATINAIVYRINLHKAADVAPVVHCRNCVYDKDCFIQKSLSIANVDNPYCCLGTRKDGE